MVTASGSALLPVLLMLFLFSAIAFGASMVARVEGSVSDRFRRSAEAFYAAEAGLAAAVAELRTVRDWTTVLSGARGSSFSEGAFSGSRTLPGGGTVLLCCGSSSAAGRLAEESRLSPSPARRALPWQPFLWTTYDGLIAQEAPTRLFLIVAVQDDQEDGDESGRVDTNGVIVARADAVEPGGARRSVEALIGRRDLPGETAVHVLRWREIR